VKVKPNREISELSENKINTKGKKKKLPTKHNKQKH
jgi:hypothetical protein